MGVGGAVFLAQGIDPHAGGVDDAARRELEAAATLGIFGHDTRDTPGLAAQAHHHATLGLGLLQRRLHGIKCCAVDQRADQRALFQG